LEQRSEYLKKWDMEGADKITDELTNTKNEKFEEIITPNGVYITFEKE